MRLRIHHLAIAGLVGIAVTAPYYLNKHIGPDFLYPNPKLSPGLVATTDIKELLATSSCGTYSACHRKTTEAMKNIIRKEYPNCKSTDEIDHEVPISIGGADDIRNLWCQPEINFWNGANWGFRAKDKIENRLAIEMKKGNISPKFAQNCILRDWIACFQFYYASSTDPVDPDTTN